MLLILLIIIALVLWVRTAADYYASRSDAGVRHLVRTEDGWDVVVWHRKALERRFVEPVVLVHGFANNHRIMDFVPPSSLAHTLSQSGFEVYSVDLRGVPGTRPPDEFPPEVTFDDHVERDVPAVLAFITEHSGSAKALWVGHSLGGLIGLAAKATGRADQVAALCTVGSPVFLPRSLVLVLLARFAALVSGWGSFPAQWATQLIAPLAGWVPLRIEATTNIGNIAGRAQRVLMGGVIAPMWSGVLRQLARWIQTGGFTSLGGLDYRAALANIAAPMLVIGGSVDALAAPAQMQTYFSLLTGENKQLLMFGKAHGHSINYGHGDLLVGKAVAQEVFPSITQWLSRHASTFTP